MIIINIIIKAHHFIWLCLVCVCCPERTPSSDSKFQEHPIKYERVTLMTKSNRGFFSNQGDVTLKSMIPSGQFSNISKIHPCPSSPRVVGTSDRNRLMLMTKSNRGFFSNQGDVTQTFTIRSDLASFELIRDFIHVHLVCKFQEYPIKTE